MGARRARCRCGPRTPRPTGGPVPLTAARRDRRRGCVGRWWYTPSPRPSRLGPTPGPARPATGPRRAAAGRRTPSAARRRAGRRRRQPRASPGRGPGIRADRRPRAGVPRRGAVAVLTPARFADRPYAQGSGRPAVHCLFAAAGRRATTPKQCRAWPPSVRWPTLPPAPAQPAARRNSRSGPQTGRS